MSRDFRIFWLDATPARPHRLRAPMKTLVKTLALIAALHMPANLLAAGDGWSSDFAASKKLAAESKKDLLIDFTGSDWCGWCIKLKNEVFDHKAFSEGVKDKFVLVEIDFPSNKAKLSEETQAQNKELGQKYAVRGYPTILLCDADGRPYAATGYQAGGPEEYVEHLSELRERKATRDKAFAAAEKASGPEKAKQLVAALDAMALQDSMITSFYGSVIDDIKKSDPKDESGYMKKVAANKRIEEFQKSLQQFAAKQDMDGALAFVDKTIEEGGFDDEQTMQLIMTRAAILAQQKKYDEALKSAEKAKALAPKSQMASEIDGFIKQIEKAKAAAAQKPDSK